MAGSELYIQPILNEEIGKLDESLQSLDDSIGNIKTVLDTVPDKIDSQIAELQELISTISAGISVVNIAGDINENRYTHEVAARTSAGDICSFTSFANGSMIIKGITFKGGAYPSTTTVTLKKNGNVVATLGTTSNFDTGSLNNVIVPSIENGATYTINLSSNTGTPISSAGTLNYNIVSALSFNGIKWN